MRRNLTSGRLCTSISAATCEEMSVKASRAFALGSDLVEFRLDFLRDPAAGDVARRLSDFVPRSVMTARPGSDGGGYAGGERERLELLAQVASMSPAFVDLELETATRNPALVRSVGSTRLIVSWHDARATPPTEELEGRARSASAFGGLAKVVTMALSTADAARVLSLYGSNDPSRLIAFCMGGQGVDSRVEALRLGSPLMYCALPSEAVAPGQITVMEMRQRLGGLPH